MVRSATRRGQSRPELRRALIERRRWLAESFPTSDGREHVRSLESGPIVLSTESMFHAHYQGVGPDAADRYVYATDPDNVRRWLLDENDVLTELDPAPCESRNCRCPAGLKSRGGSS